MALAAPLITPDPIPIPVEPVRVRCVDAEAAEADLAVVQIGRRRRDTRRWGRTDRSARRAAPVAAAAPRATGRAPRRARSPPRPPSARGGPAGRAVFPRPWLRRAANAARSPDPPPACRTRRHRPRRIGRRHQLRQRPVDLVRVGPAQRVVHDALLVDHVDHVRQSPRAVRKCSSIVSTRTRVVMPFFSTNSCAWAMRSSERPGCAYCLKARSPGCGFTDGAVQHPTSRSPYFPCNCSNSGACRREGGQVIAPVITTKLPRPLAVGRC